MYYKRLGIFTFGRQLLKTNDLDPVYVALWKVKPEHGRLRRLLLAYWWFYSLGVASKLSWKEGKEFYEYALELAGQTRTPRGTERRHFRGEAALNSVSYFRDKYSDPEDAIGHLVKKSGGNVAGVLDFVKGRWPLFGDWIGFKIADMVDRLNIHPIKFPYETLELYSEPTIGARIVCYEKSWDYKKLKISGVVRKLEQVFKNYKAPPRYERPVGVQEVETILCKWKSHKSGHYQVGKDIHEVGHGLEGWGKLAEKLLKAMPKKVEMQK